MWPKFKHQQSPLYAYNKNLYTIICVPNSKEHVLLKALIQFVSYRMSHTKIVEIQIRTDLHCNSYRIYDEYDLRAYLMRMDRGTTIGSYRLAKKPAPCFSIIMRSHSPYSAWITFFYYLCFSETNARLLLSLAFIVLNWNERWSVIEYSNVLSVNLTSLSLWLVTISCRVETTTQFIIIRYVYHLRLSMTTFSINYILYVIACKPFMDGNHRISGISVLKIRNPIN